LDDDITLCVTLLVAMPLLVFAIHVSLSHYGHAAESLSRAIGTFLVGLGFVASLMLSLWRRLDLRRRSVTGLDGELATAEELNRLMLEGYRIFHDLPFPYGNIDHVVIGPPGVFAIDTKVRGKPLAGSDRALAVVDYGRQILTFPDSEFPLPVAQLNAETRWLSEELTNAVGFHVAAAALLALPGWFVESRGNPASITVINPRNPQGLFRCRPVMLSADQIQRIAHQVERLCANVQPHFQRPVSKLHPVR
jgi:hypothetical protein